MADLMVVQEMAEAPIKTAYARSWLASMTALYNQDGRDPFVSSPITRTRQEQWEWKWGYDFDIFQPSHPSGPTKEYWYLRNTGYFNGNNGNTLGGWDSQTGQPSGRWADHPDWESTAMTEISKREQMSIFLSGDPWPFPNVLLYGNFSTSQIARVNTQPAWPPGDTFVDPDQPMFYELPISYPEQSIGYYPTFEQFVWRKPIKRTEFYLEFDYTGSRPRWVDWLDYYSWPHELDYYPMTNDPGETRFYGQNRSFEIVSDTGSHIVLKLKAALASGDTDLAAFRSTSAKARLVYVGVYGNGLRMTEAGRADFPVGTYGIYNFRAWREHYYDPAAEDVPGDWPSAKAPPLRLFPRDDELGPRANARINVAGFTDNAPSSGQSGRAPRLGYKSNTYW